MNPVYFTKKAVAGMRNTLLVNVLAAMTISVSLALFGLFLVGLINAKQMTDRLSGRLEVVAYLNDNISRESLTALLEDVEGFPEAREVRYTSKEDALKSLKEELAANSYILDGLDMNPLPASIVIKLKEGFQNPPGLKKVAGRLRGRESIDELQYGGEWLEKFSALISIIKIGGAVLAIGLVLSTMLIVSNTIRLTIQTRMDEIEVMRLAGATRLFIKAPFFIEGVMLGGIGAVFATAAMAVLKWFIGYNFGNDLSLIFGESVNLFPYQAVIGLFFFGISSGLIGSIVSLWRFPKS